MNNIQYLKGDATSPVVNGSVIVHIVNDLGAWGSGFVLALSKKWEAPEKQYHDWFNYDAPKLGDVQFVIVDKNTIVAIW